jgi:hypothetical protein
MRVAVDPTDRDTALSDSLHATIPTLRQLCTDPWCIIGSAAARLAGVETVVADIDVLCTRRDAGALMHWERQRDHDFVPTASDRFRSNFARFHITALPIEVMGDLELCIAGAWQRLQVRHLDERNFDGLCIPIPTVEEQIRILESFGRAKDHERTVLLRGLANEAQRSC